MSERKENSLKVRHQAAQLADSREHPAHNNNGDEQSKYRYMMNFSKGLEHDECTGLVKCPEKFEQFRKAIDNGYIDPFTHENIASSSKLSSRKWEAPTAGFVHSLQGPDAQAVTMPPAPSLGSDELAYEMAEVYELALLRDTPLSGFSFHSTAAELEASVGRLDSIGYNLSGGDRSYPIGHPSIQGFKENRPRTVDNSNRLTVQNAFRGSSPGVDVGPYLSQYMLIGNDALKGTGSVTDGLIRYGSQQIDQRVPYATPDRDYMTSWSEWLDVQNGAVAANTHDLYELNKRFITTPRDLATYVHHDALYQAYLNALLIMLTDGTNFDPHFKALSGQGPGTACLEAGGFALWGGPHILSLVTEVATRALKAVRWQKFNVHLRLRPEALAARIYKADEIESAMCLSGADKFSVMAKKIKPTLDRVIDKTGTSLLPMAFQEGSPMHPSYGAGHATVAGACVTILKAFFDGNQILDVTGQGGHKAYVASEDGGSLSVVDVINGEGQKGQLTVNGELNKLAANISIGRNMAGVHYYSDYFDSLRMGEAIAIGILEEQALCYPKDQFTLSLETFDGETITINKETSLSKL